MSRNFTIDTLRTVATLLVILLHVSAEYVEIAISHNTISDTSFWVGNIVDSFSRICVPLFVLISGMFLLGRNETFKESYYKRASRIFIPLISWTIIYLMFRVLLSYMEDDPISIKSLFVRVILGKPYYHMWYLFMLIGLYLITPVINKSIINLPRNTLWTVAIVLMIFGILNSGYDHFFNNNVSFILWFVNYLGYFILGFLINESKKNFSLIMLFSVYIISSIAIAILTFYTLKIYHNTYFYGYLTPFVIIGSLSFYKLFHQLKLKSNIFSRISHLTLGIYLIHAGVLSLLIIVLSKSGITATDNPIIGIPIKFTITLFISLLAAWAINSIKYLRKII